ncbi:hypothetical protein LXL04_033568 [Taraxacum kok-saghyz]
MEIPYLENIMYQNENKVFHGIDFMFQSDMEFEVWILFYVSVPKIGTNYGLIHPTQFLIQEGPSLNGQVSGLQRSVSADHDTISGLEAKVQKNVDAAVSDAIKRMDDLHRENVAMLKRQYDAQISSLEATISDLRRAMIIPPPTVPTAAEVVNDHVQQQQTQLKKNVNAHATSAVTMAQNADLSHEVCPRSFEDPTDHTNSKRTHALNLVRQDLNLSAHPALSLTLTIAWSLTYLLLLLDHSSSLPHRVMFHLSLGLKSFELTKDLHILFRRLTVFIYQECFLNLFFEMIASELSERLLGSHNYCSSQ